jgi:hypothetical protein
MNCPNGHVSTSSDYCSVCGVKIAADSEQAIASLVSPDLPSSELTEALWRIECRVFKANPASEEAAIHATYESPFQLTLIDRVTQIGRSSQKRNLHPEIACDWDKAVSHRHAKIELDPEGNAFLLDVGSTNGTMVNGKVIAANTPTKLKDGDRISLGGKTALIVHGPQE